MKDTQVLAVGYGRNLFEENSTDTRRLVAVARELGGFYMIVFSLREHGLVKETTENLTLIPTNSRSRLLMFFDAVRIGRKLMKEHEGVSWQVTAQDAFEAGCAGYLIARKKGVPLTIEQHGDFFSTSAWLFESPLNGVRWVLGLWLLRRADVVRVVSGRIKRALVARGVAKEKVRVLPIYIDVKHFQQAEAVDIRGEHSDARPVIISVCRFTKEKNLPLLIRAFAGCLSLHPNALLVLVGRGPEKERIEKLINKWKITESVRIVPWSNDVAGMMKSADICALSSNHEGWGRVLIEAMASGMAIVTTDVGAAGEALLDGVHGRVVSVGDERAFGEALAELMANPEERARLSAAAAHEAQRYAMSEEEYAKEWVAAHVTH